MKIQIAAAQRLKQTKQVQAADASDAGTALKRLTKALGKPKSNDNDGQFQTVSWDKDGVSVDLVLNTKDGTLSLEVDTDTKDGAFWRVKAKNADAFFKELRNKLTDTEMHVELDDAIDSLKELKTIVGTIDKLAKA